MSLTLVWGIVQIAVALVVRHRNRRRWIRLCPSGVADITGPVTGGISRRHIPAAGQRAPADWMLVSSAAMLYIRF